MHVPDMQRPRVPGPVHLQYGPPAQPSISISSSSNSSSSTMVPGGFSAPFAFGEQHAYQHLQAPRTHGLDYSHWVAAYNQSQQQQQAYAAQYAATQASSFGSQQTAFAPAPIAARQQPRDDGLGEAAPRIGAYAQRQTQNGYYAAPILTETEQQHAQQPYVLDGAGASAPAPASTARSPPTQLSPAASMSPSDFPPPQSGAARARQKRKRQRQDAPEPIDEGDESDDGVGTGRGGDSYSTRLPGACTHCKKLKMKCDFPADATVCKRCRNSGHQCVVEGRKPRSAPNKREYLMQQLRQKDAMIESLRKQLHNPFFATPMSISNYRAAEPTDQQSQNVVAWLDRLKTRPRHPPQPGRTSLSPTAGREPGGMSDVESVGASGENGDEAADDDSAEGTTESLVESERLIPDQSFPVGLFANLSLSATRKSTRMKAAEVVLANPDAQNEDDVGVASETYFMPGPATDMRIRQRVLEQTSPPEILVHGLVTPEDVDALFDIFFKRINIFFPLLDISIHTPASTFSRCPFLFTVICAISSRYYDIEPERAEKDPIYPLAMHFAKTEASAALIKGWKSVELCQAYILMAVYGPPARRWEEDRGWIFTGLAIRVAMDLNMHIPSSAKPQSERQAREALNKTRTWMICYNMDRSTGTQFGKPCTIKDEYIECHPPAFYASSPHNSPYDVHICGYNALLRIVGQMHTELYQGGVASMGINKRIDLGTLIPQFEEKLTRYYDEWYERIEERRIPNDPVYEMRSALLPFVYGYSKLVLHSFAFQQAFVRGVQASDKPMFMKCLDSARSTVEVMITRLAPSGYMRYSPDGWFLIASFASAFLFKLLRPQFKALVTQAQETEILELVGRLIQTLSSPGIAIDDRHTPKVYARFLASLLSRHRREGVASFSLQINPPPARPVGNGSSSGGGASGATSYGMHSQQPQPSHSTSFAARDYGAGYGMQQQQHSQAQQSVTAAAVPDDVFGGMNVDLNPPQTTPQILYNGFADDSWGSDDGHPASMQVLQTPAWWDQMMLPGFSWPPGSPSSVNGSFTAAAGSMPAAGNVPTAYSMQIPIQS